MELTACLNIATLLGCIAFSNGVYHEGGVFLDSSGSAHFLPGGGDWTGFTARGSYNNSLMTTGWNVLNIQSGYGNATSDVDVLYAAGFLEGTFTANDIHDHYMNMRGIFLTGRKPGIEAKVRGFLATQLEWARTMSNSHSTDPFWRQVAMVIAHLDGLHDGYKKAAKPTWDTDMFVVQMLNAVGDLIDLMNALDPEAEPVLDNMDPLALRQYVLMNGHCSALIKVLGAYENVYMSHSSWFAYASTLRIYKHYDFNVKERSTKANKMSFSSYPGFLESLDDFYLLSSNMVLLQTTNNVFDTSLYDHIKPESLLTWQRVRVANHMAENGEQWYQAVKRYNSGTYNNQYMVIDLKRIHLGVSIDDGALWVVEQIPGLVEGADQTQILRTGYWPSYNVPFYESVYNLSGYPEHVRKHGLDYSYQLAPRAKIFRRDQATVKDFKTMQHIMRYNDYKNDPYSEGNPCNSICCRGDLDKKNPIPNGCYDSKVTDYNMALSMQSYAINGPSLGDSLPPFQWTDAFNNTTHLGLPNLYNFDWQKMKPVQ